MDDNYNKEDIDGLLAKKIAGESNPQEEAKITAWASQSRENQQQLREFEQIWLHSGTAKAGTAPVDTEAALAQVKAHLQAAPPRRKVFNMGFLLRAAAVFTGLLGAFWYFTQDGPQEQPQSLATTAAPLTETLSDGSVVALNRQSTLDFEPGYGKKHRKMRLQGEAFFEVEHGTGPDFTVQVRDLRIRDIGTKFNVNANRGSQVLVTVTEGSVELVLGSKTLVVHAPEAVLCDLLSRRFHTQGSADANVLGYVNRQFRFEGTPLSEVVATLSRHYGVQVDLSNPAMAKCPLTSKYEGMPIDSILDVVAETFSARVTRVGTGYVLEGDGCE